MAPYVTNPLTLSNNNTIKWHSKHERIELDCQLEGFPAAKKLWYFNSVILASNNRTIIDKLDENSQGSYMCIATNEFGHQTFIYQVRLAGNTL